MTDNHTDAQNTKTKITPQQLPAQNLATDKTAVDKAVAHATVANTADKNRVQTTGADNQNASDVVKRTPAQALSSNTPKPATQATNSPEKSIKAPEAEIKKLDIVIAGTTYAIFCPLDEEEGLRVAETYINTFVTNIKKDAPNLTQENLLVLSCLNLYEKISDHEKSDNERQQQGRRTTALINKIMQDTRSIL